MKLTNVQVKNAAPKEKPYKLSDGKGLYLEVTPKGQKYWRQKYRYNGKEKRLALGVYPDVSLKDARAGCDKARLMLSDGVDPSAYKQSTKSTKPSEAIDSFESVTREWFERNKSSWAESHSSRIIRRFERDLFKDLGHRPIQEITASELLRVLRQIEERGAGDTAHRARTNCSQVFRYAVATGRVENDITTNLRGALVPQKKAHFASVTEPAEIGKMLLAFDHYTGTPVVRSALQFAPLVFVRPGEMRTAKWADIDLEKAEWRYLVTKTQTPHIVPLSRQAIEILRKLHPITGKGIYVFPSARSRRGDSPMSDNGVLSAMRKLKISKEKMTGHGFRAMARTLLDEELGFRPDVIEHQLAHEVRDPNGRAYNRTAHLADRKVMMQAWADYLDQIKNEYRLSLRA